MHFAVNFLLSVPVRVIAWSTISEITNNVSSGTLNLTQSLTHSFELTAHVDDVTFIAATRSLKKSAFNPHHVLRYYRVSA